MPPPKIAIIGAGPAGLLLARLLYRKQINVSVFEAEASPHARTQGGTLDLHPKTGLAALKAADLYEEFLHFARFESSSLTITDKHTQPYFQLPSVLAGNPEIDRVELRGLLLGSIPGEVVRWEHRFRGFVVDGESGKVEVRFENGVVEGGFDLVVGADGAWSRVRGGLSSASSTQQEAVVEPEYSGLAGYNMSIPNARERAPGCCELVRGGNLFAFSDGRSIMGQKMGDGSIYVSVWGRYSEEWAREKRGLVLGLSREEIVEEYVGWSEELLDLIRLSEGSIRINAFYMLPVGFKWTHRPGITLIGDAAHLMTPVAGEGVNIALEDAMRLAEAITSSSSTPTRALDDYIASYEREMFKRAFRAQKLTQKMMQCMYFTEGAPRTGIENWVIARAAHDCHPVAEPVVRPFLKAGVYSLYFVFKRFVR
ncbi:FAD-dependent oxidoreductase [Aspergillus ibericus CBS 121593]|uniref:FAD/NAD(P)-binding domain-containing protein n=1 Tax=Aspergillus ibericus CBS 121593 TaxID=1448316 RepID=A0A395GSD6_9EURO|nr:FAD/NAD(P)-binding domain-containing protein [Aspergillus ibericus CBS 121593]RAK98124.1 FAD/NAD(P)-binding domain-containing protein [Aspergillus ibericus CBS 121593]